MQRPQTGLLQRLWNAFKRSPRPSEGSLVGSQFPLGVATARMKSMNLEIPERPLRPVCQDLNNSYELCEMKTWSYEVSHAIAIIQRDCFQQQDGCVASWSVPEEIEDGEVKVNPDVVAIARDLSNRYRGRSLILGGNALQRAIEILWSGDSFYELGIEREGIRGNDWGISSGLFLPPFSMFVDESSQADINGYWQRSRVVPSSDDIWIHPLKMLHFSYNRSGLYGMPMLFSSLDTWRKIKRQSINIEEAAEAVGFAPWLHLMPPERDERYRIAYQQELENRRRDGVITDLYLVSGADVKKAAADSDAIAPLIDYWLKLRYQMLPPGLPAWHFPGLMSESSATKDLQSQPAYSYARMIAGLRSILGEQIKWAIAIEIVLKKGFDWFAENGRFDVEWPEWIVSPIVEQAMELNEEEGGGNSENEDSNQNGNGKYFLVR